MQKTKKQLLGIAGLAAVGVMTAVACAMPTPNAAAVSDYTNGYECDDSQPGNECAKASTENGTSIQVRVVGDPDQSSANTTGALDGKTVVDPDLEVSTSYNRVTQIDYYLIYKDANGTIRKIDLASFTPTEDNGIHRFTINLAQYGYGEYTLHTNARGYNGVIVPEDVVTFNYRAVAASFNASADNNDPVLNIKSSSDVGKLLISVYNEAGDPLFVDKEGNEVPIVLNREDIDPTTGEVLVTLPFEEYGAPAGEYAVTVVARDLTDSRTISMVTVFTDYKPVTPEVPNTGGFLASLNITRVDYLLTGLVVFGLVAGFALYLVCRKSRR